MTSLSDEREDTDIDEMGLQSGKSYRLRSRSDTDDSSELDEAECKRRRKKCLKTLAGMRKQFSVLKEQLYREKIQQVETKLKDIENEEADEYRQALEKFQESMRQRMEIASALKRLQQESIENCYKAEEQAAKQNFENEKHLLLAAMKEELCEKIRQLEEEKYRVNIQTDPRFKGRAGSRRKMLKARKKPVTVTGPYIVYMLSESEIKEDLAIIRQANLQL